MSLREMHEQQKQSSPREQLQELNRQSRTELENSLLKEALAMSSENCEELMKQSNQEQVRAEQNRQEKRLVKSGITSWKNTTIWILERRAWSMSLREMHEQQKQSSPREQLQELNRQSRTELENSLLKEALAMSSENCEELMKQSNQEQVRAEQNRQRDAEQNRKLISELKQSVELLKNSNELLQDAISGEIGSLKDEVKENTVQEVRKALQANIEAIQRATKLLEKQSDTLTSVMKQKIRELEESKNSFFRYEGLKLYLFWGGMVCNILVFLMLLYGMLGK